MKLRIEMLEDSAGRVRPYLVDAERDEVLPGQIGCRVESKLGGDCHAVVEVAFAVDDVDVTFVPSIQDDSAPEGETVIERVSDAVRGFGRRLGPSSSEPVMDPA